MGFFNWFSRNNSKKPKIKVASITDKGLVNEHNEDALIEDPSQEMYGVLSAFSAITDPSVFDGSSIPDLSEVVQFAAQKIQESIEARPDYLRKEEHNIFDFITHNLDEIVESLSKKRKDGLQQVINFGLFKLWETDETHLESFNGGVNFYVFKEGHLKEWMTGTQSTCYIGIYDSFNPNSKEIQGKIRLNPEDIHIIATQGFRRAYSSEEFREEFQKKAAEIIAQNPQQPEKIALDLTNLVNEMDGFYNSSIIVIGPDNDAALSDEDKLTSTLIRFFDYERPELIRSAVNEYITVNRRALNIRDGYFSADNNSLDTLALIEIFERKNFSIPYSMLFKLARYKLSVDTDIVEAKKLLELALKKNPSNIIGHIVHSMIMQEANSIDTGRSTLIRNMVWPSQLQVYEEYKSVDKKIKQFAAYRKEKKIDEALTLADTILENLPYHIDTAFNVIDMLIENRHLAAAYERIKSLEESDLSGVERFKRRYSIASGSLFQSFSAYKDTLADNGPEAAVSDLEHLGDSFLELCHLKADRMRFHLALECYDKAAEIQKEHEGSLRPFTSFRQIRAFYNENPESRKDETLQKIKELENMVSDGFKEADTDEKREEYKDILIKLRTVKKQAQDYAMAISQGEDPETSLLKNTAKGLYDDKMPTELQSGKTDKSNIVDIEERRKRFMERIRSRNIDAQQHDDSSHKPSISDTHAEVSPETRQRVAERILGLGETTSPKPQQDPILTNIPAEQPAPIYEELIIKPEEQPTTLYEKPRSDPAENPSTQQQKTPSLVTLVNILTARANDPRKHSSMPIDDGTGYTPSPESKIQILQTLENATGVPAADDTTKYDKDITLSETTPHPAAEPKKTQEQPVLLDTIETPAATPEPNPKLEKENSPAINIALAYLTENYLFTPGNSAQLSDHEVIALQKQHMPPIELDALVISIIDERNGNIRKHIIGDLIYGLDFMTSLELSHQFSEGTITPERLAQNPLFTEKGKLSPLDTTVDYDIAKKREETMFSVSDYRRYMEITTIKETPSELSNLIRLASKIHDLKTDAYKDDEKIKSIIAGIEKNAASYIRSNKNQTDGTLRQSLEKALAELNFEEALTSLEESEEYKIHVPKDIPIPALKLAASVCSYMEKKTSEKAIEDARKKSEEIAAKLKQQKREDRAGLENRLSDTPSVSDIEKRYDGQTSSAMLYEKLTELIDLGYSSKHIGALNAALDTLRQIKSLPGYRTQAAKSNIIEEAIALLRQESKMLSEDINYQPNQKDSLLRMLQEIVEKEKISVPDSTKSSERTTISNLTKRVSQVFENIWQDESPNTSTLKKYASALGHAAAQIGSGIAASLGMYAIGKNTGMTLDATALSMFGTYLATQAGFAAYNTRSIIKTAAQTLLPPIASALAFHYSHESCYNASALGALVFSQSLFNLPSAQTQEESNAVIETVEQITQESLTDKIAQYSKNPLAQTVIQIGSGIAASLGMYTVAKNTGMSLDATALSMFGTYLAAQAGFAACKTRSFLKTAAQTLLPPIASALAFHYSPESCYNASALTALALTQTGLNAKFRR